MCVCVLIGDFATVHKVGSIFLTLAWPSAAGRRCVRRSDGLWQKGNKPISVSTGEHDINHLFGSPPKLLYVSGYM